MCERTYTFTQTQLHTLCTRTHARAHITLSLSCFTQQSVSLINFSN